MRIRVRMVEPSPQTQHRITPTRLACRVRPSRVLHVDIEARPLHWINNEFVSKEITAMAWAWAWASEPDQVTCFLLGQDDPTAMLRAFREVFDRADLVSGHYIRGYDLPVINGAMMEYHLPPLTDKLAHDTKLDLVRRAGLSMSQENLGGLLGLQHPKVHMGQSRWRQANRLTPEGLLAVMERVTGDVAQHIELRRRLLELDYLNPPKIWRAASVRSHLP